MVGRITLGLVLAGCGGQGDPITASDSGWASEATGGATSGDVRPLSEADGVWWGDEAGDLAGSTVAFVGDVNADGEGDILVGVPADPKGGVAPGAAVLVPGPLTGQGSLSDRGITLLGSGTETAGLALTGLGDVNDDGVDDIAIGAPFSSATGTQQGAVYVLHGPVTTDSALADADAILRGGAIFALAGWSLDGGRDIDGDGNPDLLVGAKWQGTAKAPSAGTVYVFLEVPSTDASVDDAAHALQGDATEDVAGQSVAIVQDVDGDGRDDVLAGAVWHSPGAERIHAGAAYLVTAATLDGLGTGAQPLASATASFLGEAANDLAGWDVGGAGDVNGDGHGDLLITAPAHTERADIEQAGISYVVFGPAEGTRELADADIRIVGDELLEWSGGSVTTAGDQDGDGLDDVLVGSFYRSVGDTYIAGGALLFTGLGAGEVSLSDAATSFPGELAYDAAGWSTAGGVDVNGDGAADLLVGASGADRGDQADVGSAHLLLGPLAE